MLAWLRRLLGRPERWVTTGTYDTVDEATRAALDELEPGGTLTVHEAHCRGAEQCNCRPRRWTYPE